MLRVLLGRAVQGDVRPMLSPGTAASPTVGFSDALLAIAPHSLAIGSQQSFPLEDEAFLVF